MTVLPLSVTRNWSVLSLCSTPRGPSGPEPSGTAVNVNPSSKAAISVQLTEGRASVPAGFALSLVRTRLVLADWISRSLTEIPARAACDLWRVEIASGAADAAG